VNRERSSGCILHIVRILNWYINEEGGKLKLLRYLTHLEEVTKIQPPLSWRQWALYTKYKLQRLSSKTTMNPDIDVYSNLLSVEPSKYY
jgi:hypothetical protein